ncbi:MAG TPA: outer membrane lipoprotein-sorting protein [Thermoanaerobaculia bacterium]|jgi:outer membrane lipoprotein-sorting protein
MIRKTFAWLLVAGLAGAAVQAQTADELIAKNLQARGGKDKIKAMQSARMTGKMVMGQGMEAPFTMEVARPKKLRMEFTIQGMTGVQAFDGKTGWSVMPFMGKKDPETMSADEIKQTEDQADIEGMLVDYKDKGHQVEYVGKEDVEGTPAYKLKVTKKNGDVANVYLDAESYMEIKEAGKTKMHGQEMETETTFGDFKPVDGLIFPFSIESKAKGMPGGMTMTFSKVEVNPTLDASRFAMPAAEKKESPAPAKPPQP